MAPFTNLPLSWNRIPESKGHTQFVPLLHMQWLSLAQIPARHSLEDWYQSVFESAQSGLLIRGCNSHLACSLEEHGFHSVYVGQEAVLNLEKNGPGKKSIIKLANRGLRHGLIVEIPYSPSNQERIEKLKQNSTHGKLPQLRFLFQNTFEAHTRCFAFEAHNGNWLGAISISEIQEGKIQTELLLRSRQAPSGVMEALVQHIFYSLRAEGKSRWSLGEVPFLKPAFNMKPGERLLNFTGRRLRFAYNYLGLYHFKNKFEPEWQPIYICANRNINLLILGLLFLKINFLKLALAQVFFKSRFWRKKSV